MRSSDDEAAEPEVPGVSSPTPDGDIPHTDFLLTHALRRNRMRS
jgi:hypothetical protein